MKEQRAMHSKRESDTLQRKTDRNTTQKSDAMKCPVKKREVPQKRESNAPQKQESNASHKKREQCAMTKERVNRHQKKMQHAAKKGKATRRKTRESDAPKN